MAYGTSVGLDRLYIARMTTEDTPTSQAAYNAPIRIPGVIKATMGAISDSNTAGGGRPNWYAGLTGSATTISLEIASLDQNQLGNLLGATQNSYGAIRHRMHDSQTYYAVAFRSLKANGTYKYYWLFKCAFTFSGDELSTKGGTISYNTTKINCACYARMYDDLWMSTCDTGNTTAANYASHWFDSPISTYVV